VQNIFKASLTELEAAGIQAVSAQSLGTGRSAELAQEEVMRAAEAGVRLIGLDDAAYPSQLKQIYDPPLVLYVRGSSEVRELRLWARAILRPMVWAWQSAWRAIWRPVGW
jgi:DNA processing protein